MGIWESIQNPLRAEGILSSRVRWPGKKTIQLAPCFSAPAWTTRKNQGCFAELSGNGWKPQSFVFSNFLCLFNSSWFQGTLVMIHDLLDARRSVTRFHLRFMSRSRRRIHWVHPQTIPVSQVASPVQPFHFGSKSQGPLPDAVFSVFQPAMGTLWVKWMKIMGWKITFYSTYSSVLSSILLENMGFR